MTDWIRARKDNLCPICERPDGCSVSADGKVCCCSRIESDRLKGEPYQGGWIHRLDGDYKPKPLPKKKRGPLPDFSKLAMSFINNCNEHLLAESLGVSPESLRRLQVGFNGKEHTFPMKDENLRIIGIRTRSHRGKFCVLGSKTGLFIPLDLTFKERLFLPEGASDTAALLTLGFEAIGRPSCMGGATILFKLLEKHRVPEVVIVADRDKPKKRPDGSVWRPGTDGAYRLAQTLKPLTGCLRTIKPPCNKDVRDWVKDGCTAGAIISILQGTKYQ